MNFQREHSSENVTRSPVNNHKKNRSATFQTMSRLGVPVSFTVRKARAGRLADLDSWTEAAGILTKLWVTFAPQSIRTHIHTHTHTRTHTPTYARTHTPRIHARTHTHTHTHTHSWPRWPSDLRDVIPIHGSLQTNPLTTFDRVDLLDNLHHVRHFTNRYHLLLPPSHSKVTNPLQWPKHKSKHYFSERIIHSM